MPSEKYKKYLNSGWDSSTYLQQKLQDQYPGDYVKNRLTRVSFQKNLIKVPLISSSFTVPRRSSGYPPCPSRWSTSTYHLNKTFKTGMVKVYPHYNQSMLIPRFNNKKGY